MAADSWAWLADQYDYVELDHWVIMPNHIHGIIVITDDRRGEIYHIRRGGSRDNRRGEIYHIRRGGSRTAPTTEQSDIGARTAPTTTPTTPTTVQSDIGGQPAPTTEQSTPTKPLGRLIGAFKTVSTRRINEQHAMPGAKFWQRNYYEHIIRNEADLDRIREYIENNSLRWELDKLNPVNM
ncbi:transposase [bacterium]|nr:transposase [bacterium]